MKCHVACPALAPFLMGAYVYIIQWKSCTMARYIQVDCWKGEDSSPGSTETLQLVCQHLKNPLRSSNRKAGYGNISLRQTFPVTRTPFIICLSGSRNNRKKAMRYYNAKYKKGSTDVLLNLTRGNLQFFMLPLLWPAAWSPSGVWCWWLVFDQSAATFSGYSVGGSQFSTLSVNKYRLALFTHSVTFWRNTNSLPDQASVYILSSIAIILWLLSPYTQ